MFSPFTPTCVVSWSWDDALEEGVGAELWEGGEMLEPEREWAKEGGKEKGWVLVSFVWPIVPHNTHNTIHAYLYIHTMFTAKLVQKQVYLTKATSEDLYHVSWIYITMSILFPPYILHSHIVSFAWCPQPPLVMTICVVCESKVYMTATHMRVVFVKGAILFLLCMAASWL